MPEKVTRGDGSEVRTETPERLTPEEREWYERSLRYSWSDPDGDGRDDSGLTHREYLDRQRDYRRRAAEGDRTRDQERVIADSAAQASQQEQAEAEYDEYVSSGQRTADIDAGRTPRPDPRSGADNGSAASRPGSGSGTGAPGTSAEGSDEVRDVVGQIPIIGAGIQAENEQQRIAIENARAEGLWQGLDDYQLGAEDYSVDYLDGAPEHAELAGAQADAGSIEAQRDALRAMQEVYQQGGMTAADRARHQQARQMAGQQMRATREADTSALQARGMGGSGQQLASMLGAQQYGATALASQDASMLQDAQRRALEAMQHSGSMADTIRQRSWTEDTGRRGAADDFNAWRHGLRTQGRESKVAGRKYRYEQEERQVQGKSGRALASADSNASAFANRQAAQDRQTQAIGAGIEGLSRIG